MINYFFKLLYRCIIYHFLEPPPISPALSLTLPHSLLIYTITTHYYSLLLYQVSQYLIAEMMEDIMPFKEMSPLQWSIILPLLKPFVFAHQQLICTQADFCVDTYIVIDGKLEGSCSAKRLNQLLSGDSQRNSKYLLSLPLSDCLSIITSSLYDMYNINIHPST